MVAQNPLLSSNLIQVLEQRARIHPNKTAYRFLTFKDDIDPQFTFEELFNESRRVAKALLAAGANRGDRALLLYPPGIDFYSAMFGCMMAGVIGVPLYPPKRNRSDRRLESVSKNTKASFFLSTDQYVSIHANTQSELFLGEQGVWIATDTLENELLSLSDIIYPKGNDLLYLQYTSGSTSEPKGVKMTNDNVLLCIKDLHRLYGHGPEGCTVNWLPHFHDLGLILGNLVPLFWGHPTILISPADFVHQPFRWLKAITDFKGTGTAGPNFAYQICVDKITEEQVKELDLNHLQFAMIAAEPNRKETIESFLKKFEPVGFRRNVFSPAYGQAESTLNITAIDREEVPSYLYLNKDAMLEGRLEVLPDDSPNATALVGTGWVSNEQEIVIADVKMDAALGDLQEGEIWLRGPLVGNGYWDHPEKEKETFHAFTSNTKEGPFLRTGDLGFTKDKQLYITGRVKDLIIIRGLNYYPQDLEYAAQISHEALHIDAGAAFSIDVDGEERLVIAQELNRNYIRNYDADEIFTSIRKAISEEFGVQIYQIILTKPTSTLKTSSGKIQHTAMKEAYLNDELHVIEKSGTLESELVINSSEIEKSNVTPFSSQQIKTWLFNWIEQKSGIPSYKINPRESFLNYGLDSMLSVQLSSDLMSLTGREFSPALAFDYPTIDKLAMFVSNEPEFAKNSALESNSSDDAIAIVGMGCRLPGASSIDSFWTLLMNGECSVSEVPSDRWDVESYYDPDLNHVDTMSTKWGGFLNKIGHFDHSFFQIPYREASMMDPQQRLLLEVTHDALENAGIPPSSLEGSNTGVFIGVSSNDFHKKLKVSPVRGATGVSNSITANRLSYNFDWNGPSYVVDTACSSSLYAIHQACLSLKTNECSLAVAGGVNVILSPENVISFSQAGMMAADGLCKSFDSRADGYVRGEGCGVILLKKLSDAVVSGDNILAVIQGSAINQDGRSHGLTAPNGVSQIKVIQKALQNAGVSPAEVDYLEAHGSGTPLGDVIEVRSATSVFNTPDRLKKCGLGSVKTNIGHLESAAGIAGVIKAVLMIQKEDVPPHINYKSENEDIKLNESPFVISTLSDPANIVPETIGISSFGFGGANSHMILQKHKRNKIPTNGSQTSASDNRIQIATISAKSEEALQTRIQELIIRLENNSEHRPEDISYSLNAGRDHYEFRKAGLFSSHQNLLDLLNSWLSEKNNGRATNRPDVAKTNRDCVFLFPGQGTGYRNAGKELYETVPVYRDTIHRCSELFGNSSGVTIKDLLYGEIDESLDLAQTQLVQPALFTIGYALFQFYDLLGVRPSAVMGHSLGEITAATVAGVMSLESAIELIKIRVKSMNKITESGGMVAIFTDLEEAKSLASQFDRVSVAGCNGPSQTVLSGDQSSIQKLMNLLEEQGILYTPLKVSHAFHSELMKPSVEPFKAGISTLKFSRPQLPLILNSTGESADSTIPDKEYWANHITKPVMFYQGIRQLTEMEIPFLIELGPDSLMIDMAKRCLDRNDQFVRLNSLQNDVPATETISLTLIQLYESGLEINWKRYYEGSKVNFTPLPTYPFQRKYCWPEEHEIEQPSKRVSVQ